MNLRQIAEQIPAEYRREILLTNMIGKAQANGADPMMTYLATIWKNYFEPDLQLTCSQCYVRVLQNWKGIEWELVKLEREARLLNTIV
jgi:hypothetical protein